MNILHHKSWHVRNKDNIARVRRDEAKAAEEDRKKEEQVKRAEQEIRINYLRSKLISDGNNQESTTSQNKDNFETFHSKNTVRPNKEHEKEKKEEQEKYEKQIGLLTYLGKSKDNSVSDAQLQSWYDLPPKNRNLNEINSQKNSETNLKDEKTKEYYDPLKYYFRNKEKQKKLREAKNKNNKKKHKNLQNEKDLSKKDKLIILRQERLKREAIEKERQNALLLGKK